MREMILCKLGEVVLKGLNRRSFEDKLIGNLRRRTAKCGNFRIYSKQSTIYVEPVNDESDLAAAYAVCKQVFGVIAVLMASVLLVPLRRMAAAARRSAGGAIRRPRPWCRRSAPNRAAASGPTNRGVSGPAVAGCSSACT